MSKGECRQQLAQKAGKGDSPALRKILESAMSEEEARFLLDLPAPTTELAAKYGMDEPAIEANGGMAMELVRAPAFIPQQNLISAENWLMASATGGADSK